MLGDCFIRAPCVQQMLPQHKDPPALSEPKQTKTLIHLCSGNTISLLFHQTASWCLQNTQGPLEMIIKWTQLGRFTQFATYSEEDLQLCISWCSWYQLVNEHQRAATGFWKAQITSDINIHSHTQHQYCLRFDINIITADTGWRRLNNGKELKQWNTA